MKIYSMADIHGCIDEFENALSIILDDISNGRAKLVLLGDYVHGGSGNAKVLDRIIDLQNQFGTDRIIALLGNHDEMVLNGEATIHNNSVYACAEECEDDSDSDDDKYIGSMPFRDIMSREIRFSFTLVLMKKRVICGNGEHQKKYSPQNIPLKPAKSRDLI